MGLALMKEGKVMRKKIILICVLTMIIGLGSLSAQNLYQQVGERGTVDWTDGVVRAKGMGAPNPDLPLGAQRAGAIRAAESDALRQLLETVQGVQVTSVTTVENFMLKSDVINRRVTGMVKGFRRVGEPRFLPDGSVELEVEMSLRGKLTDLLLPEKTGGGTRIVSPPPGIESKAYTGLVVDARGLKVRPAMAPKILTPDGQEVYGTGFISREYAIKQGIAGYAKDLEMSRKDERVADNPLVVKAIGAAGKAKTNLVISDQDAGRLHALAENLSFLEKCRVMIVVD